MDLSRWKQLSLKIGLYRQARMLHRLAVRKERRRFKQDLRFYANLIAPGSLCFDVGANTGAKSEALLRAGATVVAFEPQPECVRELQARCRPYRDRLLVRRAALGAESGQEVLYLRESSGQSSLLSDWEGIPKGTITTPVTTLDLAIAEFGKPAYCKVDVEGYELNVMRGLSQAIPLISLEYHLQERQIQTCLLCLEYLAKLGVLHINLTPAETLALTFANWLTPAEFREAFPNKVGLLPGHHYGDLFIRMS